MSEHPITGLMNATIEKIKQMVDANTVLGKPILTPDGTTVLPISRISFGFGTGGSDYVSKHAKDTSPLCFGGGGGAGVNVIPIAFLIIDKGGARILPINAQADTTVDRLVEMIPDAFSKVSSFFEERKAEKKMESEAESESEQK